MKVFVFMYMAPWVHFLILYIVTSFGVSVFYIPDFQMSVLAISVMFIKTLGYFESSGPAMIKNLVFAKLSSLLWREN